MMKNQIKSFFRNAAAKRKKRKSNPLLVSEHNGGPVWASRLYSSIDEASAEFGKKLQEGFNRVGSKEVWVTERNGGKIGVSPIVHAHGLRLGIESLDRIEKEQKISSLKGARRFGLRSGWGSKKEFTPLGKSFKLGVLVWANPVMEKGPFYNDQIQVLFVPKKTPFWSDDYSTMWHKNLPLKEILQIRVFCHLDASEMTSEEKMLAYKKRFPKLAENANFEFIWL